MEIINSIFRILGSLGLFIYGMKLMSDGIQKSAGERLQVFFNYVTLNRFFAIFTGFFITAIIQSSSATTVMVVSFVNAGLMNLVQSIGVIMGANIGTTVTSWIVAIFGFKFSISKIALPIIGIGFLLYFYKKVNKKDLGEACIGFGLLFLGLSFLKDSMPDLKHNPEILHFLANFTRFQYFSRFFFIFAGATITVIVHSSSASMAIILSLAASGVVDFQSAAALAIGGNIGTTIDAFLASINANVNARRAAWFHILFNIIGALWVAVLLSPVLKFIDYIVPGVPVVPLDGSEEVINNAKGVITLHLAMFHFVFNLANTIALIGFIPTIAKLIKKMVKVKAKDRDIMGKYELKYFSAVIQDTAEINIVKAKNELSAMAKITQKMFSSFFKVFNSPDKDMGEKVEDLKHKEDYVDQMQEEISQFLVDCSKDSLNEVSIINVNAMLRIVNELESVADSCYNLILLTERKYKKKINFNEEAVKNLEPYYKLINKFFNFIQDHLNEHLSKADFDTAYSWENDINKKRNQLKKGAQQRLKSGANVKEEILYIDIIGQMEKVGDYLLNIASSLKQMH